MSLYESQKPTASDKKERISIISKENIKFNNFKSSEESPPKR